jgi:hypothetical protein
MRKRLLLVLVLTAVGMTGVRAGELTGKQALELAQQFVSGHSLRKSTPTVKEAGQVSGLYVFNVSNDGGFVIVSNDDQTVPILGFGQSGNIDVDNLPDNMRAWLEGYAAQIAWLKTQSTQSTQNTQRKAPRRTATPKADIGPLVSSHWNQGAPYNGSCPEIDGEKTVTGCLATTMAQLVYYHYVHNGYAASSTALEGYTVPALNKAKENISLVVDGLAATTFDWANMTDTYGKASTDEQKTAVATLMRYVGTALHMSYGLSAHGGSAAYNEAIPYALKHCFGFDGGIEHRYRKNYSYTDWVEIIYSELAESRPVALGGQSAGGGHSFICDGYKYESDIDYFHINWGWGGSSDEYFVLSVLQPWEQGIGGSSTLDGFSFGQDAVIGIQPPTTGTKYYCMSLEGLHLGGDDASLSSKTFTRDGESGAFKGISINYDVWNYHYGSGAYDVTVQLTDGDGKVVLTFGGQNNQPQNWNAHISGTLSALIPSDVEDGTYYIKVMSRPNGEENWQECFDGDAYKLTATVSGNDLTVSVPIPGNVTPAGVTFAVSGESMTGAEQTVTATVTGGTGSYSGDIILRVNGKAVMGQIGQIPAGQTVSLTFSFIPSYVGDNTLTLWTHKSSGTQIPGSETVSISTLVINNSGTGNTNLIQLNNSRTGNVRLAGRTLYKDGKWNTLCLPFDLSLAGSVLDGAEVRTLSDASLSNGILTLNFDDPVSTISAGTPYIIRWDKADGYDVSDPATRDIVNPVFEAVTIVKDYNDFVSTDGKIKFLGRYSAVTYQTENRSTLLLGGDNTLYFPQPALTDPDQPYSAETNPWLYPFVGACRSYFQLTGVTAGDPSSAVREFVLNFSEENTTGVVEAEANWLSPSGRRAKPSSLFTLHSSLLEWYSLDGRRLNGKPTTKGLYIHGGKKVVIK